MNASFEVFLREVIRFLPPTDFDGLPAALTKLHEAGFTISDAVRYARCWEEINPDLDEDVALKRMREIAAKYPLLGKGRPKSLPQTSSEKQPPMPSADIETG